MRATITGVGHYVPEKRLTNADLEKLVDTTDEWITTRTGIKERRILQDGEGTSYMAIKAAKDALATAKADPLDIDLIIVGTLTPDMPVPGSATIVQAAIGAANSWCYDINGGCSGFLCSLVTGIQFVESGRYKKVLVIGADKMSVVTDYTDRSTCILLGDAAGAVVLEPSSNDNEGIIDFIMKADGGGAHNLRIEAGGSLMPASCETVLNKQHFFRQEGQAVFKRAVREIADVAEEIVIKNGLQKEDIDLLVPHQANLRIIDAAARRLNLPIEKVVINIDRYGNSSAGTIPTALSEAWRQGRIEKGDYLLFAAFGAGYMWGSILLKWTMDKPDK